jgi:hypothetical protein
MHEQVLFNYLTFLHGLASSKKTTVMHALKVANFAFKLHGLGSKAGKPEMELLRLVNKRKRATKPRKKTAIDPREVAAMMARWGNSGAPQWQRTVMLGVALMFDLTLRYNDLAQLRIDKLEFRAGRCLVGTAMAKSNQDAVPEWLVLADKGTASCTFRRLVAELKQRGFVVPAQGFIRLKKPLYVWPNLVRVRRAAAGPASYRLQETDRPRLPGVLAAGAAGGYEQFRRLFKAALQECLGYHDGVLGSFSSHSMRRGSNTFKFLLHVPKRQRMATGRWSSEQSEEGYCDPPDAVRASMAAASQLG